LRKDFFSEEKKQKTFNSLSRSYPAACRQNKKFFGSFFKKELLASLLIGFAQLEWVFVSWAEQDM
jgi:hypothetical protein